MVLRSRNSKFILFAFFSLILLFSSNLIATDAFATPAEEKQAEAAAALEQLNELQADLDVAEENYHQAVAEQEAAEAKVKEAEDRIEEANARIEELQVKLATRARAMYTGGDITIFDLLFGCASWTEFATTWDLLNSLNKSDAEMVQETKDLKAEIEEQKIVLEEQSRVAAEKAELARVVKEDAEATVAEMQAIYDGLSAEAAQLLEEERAAAEAARAQQAQQELQQQQQSQSSNSNRQEPAYNAATGNAVVDRAYSYVGNADYVWGACSPGAFDCSGFVSYCLTGSYSRLGTTYTFLNWPQVYDPQPGDICVNSGHCGIYIGGGQMIHAASPGQGVCIGGVQGGMIYVRP